VKRSILALVLVAPGLAWADPHRLVFKDGIVLECEVQRPEISVVITKQDVAAPVVSVPELPRLADKIVESAERAPFEEP
jgi:hypothetical protein